MTYVDDWDYDSLDSGDHLRDEDYDLSADLDDAWRAGYSHAKFVGAEKYQGYSSGALQRAYEQGFETALDEENDRD